MSTLSGTGLVACLCLRPLDKHLDESAQEKRCFRIITTSHRITSSFRHNHALIGLEQNRVPLPPGKMLMVLVRLSWVGSSVTPGPLAGSRSLQPPLADAGTWLVQGSLRMKK